MQKPPSNLLSRRDALLLAAAAGAVGLPRHAFAESQRLDIKDPAAVAVGYVENASQVDANKYSNYARGSTCGNCMLLQGSAGAAYRPCDFFQGKLVAVAGWCSAWSPEM